MPNLDLAKKRVEAEIAKYGGIHIEGEARRAEEDDPVRKYNVLNLDSDNKPIPYRRPQKVYEHELDAYNSYSRGLRKKHLVCGRGSSYGHVLGD
jgi:hypothetical protein